MLFIDIQKIIEEICKWVDYTYQYNETYNDVYGSDCDEYDLTQADKEDILTDYILDLLENEDAEKLIDLFYTNKGEFLDEVDYIICKCERYLENFDFEEYFN